MRKQVTFDELPESLKDRILSIGGTLKGEPIKVIRCEIYDSDQQAGCIVQDSNLFGIYNLNRHGEIKSHWIGRSDIEFLYSQIQKS